MEVHNQGAPDREWRPLPHPTVNLPVIWPATGVGGQTRKTRDKLNSRSILWQQVAGSVSHLAGRVLPHPHEQGRKSGHTGTRAPSRAPSAASGGPRYQPNRGEARLLGHSEISRPLASWTSAPRAQRVRGRWASPQTTASLPSPHTEVGVPNVCLRNGELRNFPWAPRPSSFVASRLLWP